MTGDQFTTVEFSPENQSSKREIVLHPDELVVQLTLDQNDVQKLTLHRQRDLDLSKIPVFVDGEEWKEESEDRSKVRLSTSVLKFEVEGGLD